jgi:hypothetical protein
VAAAGGLGHQLGGQARQDAGLVFGLGRQHPRGSFRLQVEHRPQIGQDVRAVQAQVVRGPAGGEGGAGRVANGINTVHLSYVRARTGRALIDARQWIPQEHIEDPVKSLVMGLPY